MQRIDQPVLAPSHAGFPLATLARGGTLIGWLALAALAVGPVSVPGDPRAAGLGGWIAGSLGSLLAGLAAALILFCLPGLALLRYLWPDRSLSGAERFGMAVGLSMALPPLLLGAARLVGLPWTPWTTWMYALAAAGALMWPARSPVASWRRLAASLRTSLAGPLACWHATGLAALLLVGLAVRVYAVRDLPAGLWGDSYHHTMITQLLLDNRGLFASWQPYVPLDTFTYHYGFHANAALFAWMTGSGAERSVVLVGQIAGAATIAAAYLLTARLSGLRMAGLWAAALTGFFNTMPAYYVNWGRYTQLLGQVVLPALVICWMAALERPRFEWRPVILAVLASSGLVLTHYLVAIFAAVFIGSAAIVLFARRPDWAAARRFLLVGAAIAGLSGLLLLPWIVNITKGRFDNLAARYVTQAADSFVAEVTALPALSPFYVKGWLVALAFAGCVLALIKRHWRIALCALWSLGLILLAVPHAVGLPGRGMITSFTAYIALYITVIPLAAYALALLGEAVANLGGALAGAAPTRGSWAPAGQWRRAVLALTAAGLIAVSLWGAHWQARIIDPASQILTPADARAMDWIRGHAADDARFLVNGFPAYNQSLFVGDDGGWWIPLLTGRQNTVPPIVYMNERSPIADYRQQVNEFGSQMRAHPLPSPAGLALCREAGIDYIYIGPHITANPDNQRIDVQALRDRPDQFPIVYEHDGVIIFALKY